MASLNELVEGDYVRWYDRDVESYAFGTVDELKSTPAGNVEAYISKETGGQASKLVTDLVKIEGGI